MATYTINDERKQKVGFAGPYYVAGQDIMVKAGDTSITGKESLDGKTGVHRVGVDAGEAGCGRRRRPRSSPSTPTASAPRRSATAGSRPSRPTTSSSSGSSSRVGDAFKLVGEPFSSEPYGIGVKLGADDLRGFINDVLEQSYEDGSWKPRPTRPRSARSTRTRPSRPPSIATSTLAASELVHDAR